MHPTHSGLSTAKHSLNNSKLNNIIYNYYYEAHVSTTLKRLSLQGITMAAILDELTEAIIRHEGCSRYVYKDSEGFDTIGIGRCVDSSRGRGLSLEEQNYLLKNDIAMCRLQLAGLPAYELSDQVRKDVLVELCFNMGIKRLMLFHKMIQAMVAKDYELAAKELLDSNWAIQVQPSRVADISYRLTQGKYKNETRAD